MKTLWTLPDVLDLVLPKAIKDAIFMTPELKDAIISAVVEQLLEKVGPGCARFAYTFNICTGLSCTQQQYPHVMWPLHHTCALQHSAVAIAQGVLLRGKLGGEDWCQASRAPDLGWSSLVSRHPPFLP